MIKCFFLAALVLCAHSHLTKARGIPCPGVDDYTVPSCAGKDDTSALSAAVAADRSILIPAGVTCATGNLSISVPLVIAYGGRLRPLTRQTVTLTSGFWAGGNTPWQAFTNALSGEGRVSFAGNLSIREVYPQWWGAKGNGTNDDTGAIGAADAAACTGEKALDKATVLPRAAVYFIPGTYKHTGLTYCGAPWIGTDMNSTILDYYGSGAAINAVGTAGARKVLSISDMLILGSHAGAGAYGLQLGFNQRSFRSLNRVQISSFPSWGIYFLANSWIMSFYDVYLLYNGKTSNGGIGVSPAVTALGGLEWFNLVLENNGTPGNGIGGGIELNNVGVGQWMFHGGTWEGNRGLAEARFINASAISIDGVFVESERASSVSADGLIFGGITNASLRGVLLTAVGGHGGKALRFIGNSNSSIDNLWIHPANWTTSIDVEDTAKVTMLSEGNITLPNIVTGEAALIRATPKIVTLTDAPTIAVDASQGTYFTVTLGGNRMMGVPTNSSTGQRSIFVIKQDRVGGRKLTWPVPAFKNAWSDIGNTAGAETSIVFVYRNSEWRQESAQITYH